jgi:putative DNA primase/helicase
MTGRDPIAARFLYGDEFTFVPEFKLWLLVNRPPRVGDDEAFWSRPHRIPFRTSFRGREDTTLKDRLLAEREGILAWLVRGALDWQCSGPSLEPPDSIAKATDEYREEESPLAEFLDACCVLRADAWTSKDELRTAYARWAEKERVRFRLGPKRFYQEVGKRFKTVRPEHHGAPGYIGVGLVATQGREPGDDSETPF